MMNEKALVEALVEVLHEIAGLPHDEECDTQMAQMGGRPQRDCSCHVGMAERAVDAWSAEMKPIEHPAAKQAAVEIDLKVIERWRKALLAHYENPVIGSASECEARRLDVEVALLRALGCCPRCGTDNYGPDDMGFESCRDCGFVGSELSIFSRYLNHARTGAAYDLTTRVRTRQRRRGA